MNNFFYIMQHSHNKKVGFGITGNVRSRIYDYIAGSAELQSFKYLYYGPKTEIVAIEKMLKAEWKRYMWSIFKGNKWSLEILDPVHGLTTEDVKNWIETKISELNLPIKPIKNEWLPYQGDKRVTRKYLDLSPELYIDA